MMLIARISNDCQTSMSNYSINYNQNKQFSKYIKNDSLSTNDNKKQISQQLLEVQSMLNMISKIDNHNADSLIDKSQSPILKQLTFESYLKQLRYLENT